MYSKSIAALVAVMVLCLLLVAWFRPWTGGTDTILPEVREPIDVGSVAFGEPEVAPKAAVGGAEGPVRIEVADEAGAQTRIDVTVRENGEPLPDVAVELLMFAGAGEAGTPERRALRTDASGRASVSVPASDDLRTFKLVMDDPRRRMWCDPVVVVPSERHVTIEASTLHFDGVLRGVVRDAHEAPIAGATVSLSGWHEARSDVDGRYQLRVPTGRRTCSVVAYAAGFRQTRQAIPVPAGADEHDCDIVLLPGAQIAGLVVDGRGAPVEGAHVKASGSFLQSRSGADGRFVLDCLEPDSMQQLRAESAAGGVCVTYAKAGADVELVLVEGLRVGGRVQDEAGRPVAGARVLVQPESGASFLRTWSDREGRFTVSGLFADSVAYRGDKIELIVRRKGFSDAVVALDLGSDLRDLTITLGTGRRIRGRVVDSNGSPIPDTRVVATLVRNVNWRLAGPPTQTDADGRFELHPIAEEPCSVRAVKPGFNTVTVEAGGTVDIEIELRMAAGASIAGRVVDASSGEPVRAFSVRASSVRPQARSGPPLSQGPVKFTSDEGLWRIPSSEIVAGVGFDVRVTAPGYGTARGVTFAAADASPDRCVIRLQRAVELVGVVRDATTGVALAGAELRAQDSNEVPGAATVTDAQGHFTLADVGAGSTSLHVRAHGYPPLVHGPFDVGVGPGTQRLDIGVTRGVTLRGRLEGFGDLANVVLQIDIADNFLDVPIAADSTFAVGRLGRGARTMYLTLAQTPTNARVYRVVVPEKESEPIVLRAREGDASLTVIVDGATEGGASITPLSAGTGRIQPLRRSLGFVGGTFRADDLAPGRYRVDVSGSGSGRRGSAEVDVAGEARLTVVVDT